MGKRILILNLIPNTIGDNILLTPIVSILKKNNPKSSIDITVSNVNKELFENNPNISKIHEFDELQTISLRNISKVSKLLVYVSLILKSSSTLRKMNYGECFVFLPNFPLNILIPKFAGINKIYGYTYKNSFLSFFLKKKIEYRGIYETKDYTRHFVESYLDLLRCAGVRFSKKDVVSKVYVSKKEIEKSKMYLKKKRVNDFICFQIGSKDNSWPFENFSKVSKHIINKTKKKILLIGSPAEYILNEHISKLSSRIINTCNDLSLREKAAILSLADFSICNDSGIAHLSSSVSTKTIVLFGPHSPKHSTPIGPGKTFNIYKFSDFHPYARRGSKEGQNRINAICVDDVINVVDKLL